MIRLLYGTALFAVLTLAPPAAAQFTWDNPAGGSWSVGTNWVGGTAPIPGLTTALTFGSPPTQAATYTATNTVANPFQLNGLTFNNTAGTVTLAGGGLTFDGISPTVIQSGAGSVVIDAAVILSATTTVAGTGTGPVTITGAVNGGANNLVKDSAGLLTLAAGGSLNTLSLRAGGTSVTGGTLALTAPTGTNNADSGLQLGAAAGQTATFTASGGARVNVTENAYIGDAAGSTGTVTVTGAGTIFDNTPAGQRDLIGVGHNGTGTLNVTAGGVVSSVRLYVATFGGSTGDVVVDGTGSAINTTEIRVGNLGTGTLTVQSGGAVNAGVTVTQFPLIVGNVGTGTLTVRDGGSVTTPMCFLGTGDAGTTPGIGTVTVTGAGSSFTVGPRELWVGVFDGGTGTLNVQDGGLVTAQGDLNVAFFDGQGTINVTGAGSRLNVGNLLSLGIFQVRSGDGFGVLNVGAGGAATVTGRVALYATGTINLDAGGALSIGGLANGVTDTAGVVNVAAGTSLTITDGGTTFSGVITGAGGITKAGPGVQTLVGASTYTGPTTVSAGTLRLTGTASFAGSQRITVGTDPGSSAVLDVFGLTGGANFADGRFALAAGQTLAGHGTVAGPVTVRVGSTVAPGTSVGTLAVGGMTWQGGGRYEFEFDGATGDRVTGGSLDLNSLSSTNRFTIHIATPGPPGGPPQAFTIGTFTGGITGFDPAGFDFTGFFAGPPVLTLNGNSLVLTFTPAPEPSQLLLLSAAAAGLIRRRLRRRR